VVGGARADATYLPGEVLLDSPDDFPLLEKALCPGCGAALLQDGPPQRHGGELLVNVSCPNDCRGCPAAARFRCP
jgi:hypothetical protein